MTNTKNKKNNTKKLLGAVGMLSISAAMLVSSTFAWFTMNRTVEATNMTVKATAEGGLLISETAGHTASDLWDDVATANNLPASVVLLPTSTAASSAWYHANSKSANDEAGAAAASKSANLSGDYTTLSGLAHQDTAASSGANAANSIFYTDANSSGSYTAADDSAYYVKYTYYLKSSNESGISSMGLANNAQNLSIKDVTVTGASDSTVLDKSLRVGVKIGGKFYIYAPAYGTSETPADYYVFDGADGDSNIKITPIKTGTVAYTDVASLGGITTDSPLQVDIYCWFEGEDENCKSENVTGTLDQLVVNVKFELSTNSAVRTLPADNAKTVS